MASKRGNAMKVVTGITGVPDAIAGIMAEYLAVDYLSDKSKQCANFKNCHQNLRFRHVDKGDTLCIKCWREFIEPRDYNLSDDYGDEGWFSSGYD
jgi:hypothetical protein